MSPNFFSLTQWRNRHQKKTWYVVMGLCWCGFFMAVNLATMWVDLTRMPHDPTFWIILTTFQVLNTIVLVYVIRLWVRLWKMRR